VVARKAPEFSKRLARRIAERNLPDGYDIDTHFTPPYKPWDQRLCILVGADLYKAISLGGLDMVTDHIDRVDATGIVLRSGRHVDADVIITATGIQLQALGGITLSVDGAQIDPHDRFVFRRHLLEDVPNAAWCIGYTNASWTLGADLTARSVAKLLAYMDSHGYTRAYPHLGKVAMPEQPAFNLQSGYVLRSPDELPKSGTRRPWVLSHNFVRDVLGRPFESIEESMVFGRAATASAGSPPSRATATRTIRMSS
jgi:cation diffusion facilitator CzcD-associated flavoprotein CzcO